MFFHEVKPKFKNKWLWKCTITHTYDCDRARHTGYSNKSLKSCPVFPLFFIQREKLYYQSTVPSFLNLDFRRIFQCLRIKGLLLSYMRSSMIKCLGQMWPPIINSHSSGALSHFLFGGFRPHRKGKWKRAGTQSYHNLEIHL